MEEALKKKEDGLPWREKIAKMDHSKFFVKKITQMLESPFPQDRHFMLRHLVQISRDNFQLFKPLIWTLFHSQIMKFVLQSLDDEVVAYSIQIISNMMTDQECMNELYSEDYIKFVFARVDPIIDQFISGNYEKPTHINMNRIKPVQSNFDDQKSTFSKLSRIAKKKKRFRFKEQDKDVKDYF